MIYDDLCEKILQLEAHVYSPVLIREQASDTTNLMRVIKSSSPSHFLKFPDQLFSSFSIRYQISIFSIIYLYIYIIREVYTPSKLTDIWKINICNEKTTRFLWPWLQQLIVSLPTGKCIPTSSSSSSSSSSQIIPINPNKTHQIFRYSVWESQ